MVPHSCLEKADERTRKKHNLKFRHIGYNVDPYGQSFFSKYISAWNGLAQEIWWFTLSTNEEKGQR